MAPHATEFAFLAAPRSAAWLFPGQGSQHVGMVAALAAAYPVADATLREADDLLGAPIRRLCLEGPEEELTDTVNAQPALLAASVAVLRVLAQELGAGVPLPGAAPNSLAGHSMGEYSALVAAGSLAYGDGLRLVRTRGRLMKQAGERTPGMMAAVLGMDELVVAELCRVAEAESDGVVQVANDNCPGQIVISGDRPGMEAAMAALTAAGARKVIPLAVSIAAHSPLMRPAAEELVAAIDATEVRAPLLPVYGNTTARPLTSAEEIRAELAAQLTGSVRWTSTMQAMLGQGVRHFIEVGPGEVLTGLAKRMDRTAERLTINSPESVVAAVRSLTSG